MYGSQKAGWRLEYETLSGEESKRVIVGEDIGRHDGSYRRPQALGTGGSSIPKTRRPRGGGVGDPAPQGA